MRLTISIALLFSLPKHIRYAAAIVGDLPFDAVQ
jgi:hypothetical protein